jgi:hypothetical protein
MFWVYLWRNRHRTSVKLIFIALLLIGMGMSVAERYRKHGGGTEQLPPQASTALQTEHQVETTPSDPNDAFKWETGSASGQSVLSQRKVPSGLCQLTCRRGDADLWNSTACISTRVDFRFIAEDCERLVVIHAVPERSNMWQHAQVAHVYKRGGKLDYAVVAGAVVKGKDAERNMNASVRWLRGEPAYSADGSQVSFTSIDGRAQQIPLSAK